MRINFFGGPGAGKSTTTARVFSQLKEQGYSVEHVGEYVKAWAYQNRKINKWDQVYLFGKQQQYEYRFLSQGVKNIVTDSPCLLSVIYASKAAIDDEGVTPHIAKALQDLSQEYERDYPSLDIFLHRGDKEYKQEGRYQSKEEAQEIDALTLDYLKRFRSNCLLEIDFQDKEGILNTVLNVVEK